MWDKLESSLWHPPLTVSAIPAVQRSVCSPHHSESCASTAAVKESSNMQHQNLTGTKCLILLNIPVCEAPSNCRNKGKAREKKERRAQKTASGAQVHALQLGGSGFTLLGTARNPFYTKSRVTPKSLWCTLLQKRAKRIF